MGNKRSLLAADDVATSQRRIVEGGGRVSSVTPRLKSATTWIRHLHRYIHRVRRRRQKQWQRWALDHFSSIRVKLRLCGATPSQATGDYNGIYARLAYELRLPAPSSTSLVPLSNPLSTFFAASLLAYYNPFVLLFLRFSVCIQRGPLEIEYVYIFLNTKFPAKKSTDEIRFCSDTYSFIFSTITWFFVSWYWDIRFLVNCTGWWFDNSWENK